MVLLSPAAAKGHFHSLKILLEFYSVVAVTTEEKPDDHQVVVEITSWLDDTHTYLRWLGLWLCAEGLDYLIVVDLEHIGDESSSDLPLVSSADEILNVSVGSLQYGLVYWVFLRDALEYDIGCCLTLVFKSEIPHLLFYLLLFLEGLLELAE